MIHYTCDMCGREMSPDELRYVISMNVAMAQDPLECACDDDADTDHLEELTEIIAHIEATGEEDPPPENVQQFQYDVCPHCRKKFVQSPLGRETVTQQLNFSKN